MATTQEEIYAYEIAVAMNFVPQENAKFEALPLGANQFNFRLAKQFGDDTNIWIAYDGTEY